MRAVVQRVKKASVNIDDALFSEINDGLLVYIGISTEDTEKDMEYIKNKVLNLRIFDDVDGIPNLSVVDKEYSILLVSQFTLYGDARHGRRPSYSDAMHPEEARPVFKQLVELFTNDYPRIQTGLFQAEMKIDSMNDGPFTILLDSRRGF